MYISGRAKISSNSKRSVEGFFGLAISTESQIVNQIELDKNMFLIKLNLNFQIDSFEK